MFWDIYIGWLMGYIYNKVAICSLWTVCPCYDKNMLGKGMY